MRISDWSSDVCSSDLRIGGLSTLLLGSTMQAVALACYLPFSGLTSLYIVSALFGLMQGGIVPSYAFIIRELFPAREAGFRVSITISATMAGMRSEEHTSELQSLMRISYAVFCLKKTKNKQN